MTLVQRNPIYTILIVCSAAMGVAALGILLAKDSHDAYLQPALSAQGSVFVYVWPALFLFMALSAALIRIEAGSFTAASEPLGLFFTELGLALGWCIIAFRFYEPVMAIGILGTLFILTLLTMLVFAKQSSTAAWLQLPWLIWVSLALYLSVTYFVF